MKHEVTLSLDEAMNLLVIGVQKETGLNVKVIRPVFDGEFELRELSGFVCETEPKSLSGSGIPVCELVSSLPRCERHKQSETLSHKDYVVALSTKDMLKPTAYNVWEGTKFRRVPPETRQYRVDAACCQDDAVSRAKGLFVTEWAKAQADARKRGPRKAKPVETSVDTASFVE